MNRQDVEWSKFASGLLGYIDAGLSRFIETDYKIDLNMSMGEILHELQESTSIDQLSSDLQGVAKEYERHSKKQ